MRRHRRFTNIGLTLFLVFLSLNLFGANHAKASQNMQLISSTPGFVKVLAIQQNYVYVTDAATRVDGNSRWIGGDLFILDVTDPANPRVIGTYNMPNAIKYAAVVGATAYVLDEHVWNGSGWSGGGLHVLDVSDPSQIIERGFLEIPTDSHAIGVEGNHVYVATDWRGAVLHVIDVNDPARPIEVGSFIADGISRSLAVSGHYAYLGVTGPSSGVYMIDVSNPASPVQVGQYAVLECGEIEAAGNYVYVAANYNGLRVIDVSVPGQISEVSTFTIPSSIYQVELVGNQAFVTAASSGVQVLDLSNPNQITWVGAYDIPSNPQGIAAANSYVYICDPSGAFLVIRFMGAGSTPLSTPTPVRQGQNVNYAGEVLGQMFEIAVRDDYAYVGTFDKLAIFDISNPANPVLLGQTPPLLEGVRVEVIRLSGTFAYVFSGARPGVHIVDISNPRTPTVLGAWDPPGQFLQMAVAGSNVYVTSRTTSGDGLHILDASNPAVPVEVAFLALGPRIADISGNYAYALIEFGFKVVDISNPLNPTDIAVFNLPGNHTAMQLKSVGNKVYVRDYYGGLESLNIIDVSNPRSPVGRGVVDLLSDTGDFALFDNYAYVVNLRDGFHVYDINDPRRPVEVGAYYPPPFTYMTKVGAKGNYSFVSQESRLLVLDFIAPPNTPTPTTSPGATPTSSPTSTAGQSGLRPAGGIAVNIGGDMLLPGFSGGW